MILVSLLLWVHQGYVPGISLPYMKFPVFFLQAFIAILSLAAVANSHPYYSNSYDSQPQLVRVERQLAGYPPAPEPVYGQPANYDFEWMVKDDYSRNDYGHKESRKEQQTQVQKCSMLYRACLESKHVSWMHRICWDNMNAKSV